MDMLLIQHALFSFQDLFSAREQSAQWCTSIQGSEKCYLGCFSSKFIDKLGSWEFYRNERTLYSSLAGFDEVVFIVQAGVLVSFLPEGIFSFPLRLLLPTSPRRHLSPTFASPSKVLLMPWFPLTNVYRFIKERKKKVKNEKKLDCQVRIQVRVAPLPRLRALHTPYYTSTAFSQHCISNLAFRKLPGVVCVHNQS